MHPISPIRVQRDTAPVSDRSSPGLMSELKAESERPLFASRERKEAGGDASAEPSTNVGVAVCFGEVLWWLVQVSPLFCPTV